MKAFDFRDLRNVLLSDSEISKYGLRFGDLLFIRVNGSKEKVGACYEVSEREPGMAFCDHLMRGRTCHTELSPFLARAVTAPSIKEAITARVICASGQNTISQGVLAGLLVPVPPLAEQRRIVAELDRLLALVDGVERDSADLGALRARARSKVLDLAVRGLLVPRDASDEPASALLGRIREERAELVREGGAKAPKGGFSVIERRSDGAHYEKRGKGEPVRVEVPYDLPEGWAWARLGSLCVRLSRGKSPKYTEERRYPVFAQKCNQPWGITLEKVKFLDPDSLPRYDEQQKLRAGDVLINSTGTGTLGRVGLFDEALLGSYPFIVPDSHVTVVRCSRSVEPKYVEFFLKSAVGQGLIFSKQTGSTNQKELPCKEVEQFLVPVPPLAEQKRIAKMVDAAFDLMD